MSNEPSEEELRWLLKPPQKGEVTIRTGPEAGAKLSPEERVKKLHAQLDDIIVGGHGTGATTPCEPFGECNPPFTCGLAKCDRVIKAPGDQCAIFVSCRIQD